MTEKTLIQLCKMILAKLGFESETFVSLVEKWRFFIDECECGYQWDYSEYLSEIRARHLIQQLLNNEEVAKAEEFQELIVDLGNLDQKFRELLQPEVLLEEGEGWWDKGVLKKAGEDYCQYMYDAHGINVVKID
ncbi:hypothetical protein [Vibrio caribbeanicus]|uniref:Uncharacterized protein n=1 Tax=Vibrio caribbeanicus ATCC BAA-2122 TaxID=796620 RepID=E3BI46_9VIBR|nr:hypothetical protein [Vibrio caribbeanicus]EFP97247.1 hypothetical protein VIBC2010_09442 [Vibrio caribbeanicus ATCC BAA-2122]